MAVEQLNTKLQQHRDTLELELDNALASIKAKAEERGIASFSLILVPETGAGVVALDVTGYRHPSMIGLMEVAKNHIINQSVVTEAVDAIT